LSLTRRFVATLIVVGLLFTSLKLYSDYAIRQAEAAYPPVGQFVTTEGVAMHYLERGSGRPIVLIHGSDGALQDFLLSGLIDRLATEYRVIAFDRPGHGYSGRPTNQRLTFALNARLIHGALQQLGVERPIIAGHSYGGAVALQYAVDYPAEVAALLLLAPGAFSESGDLSLLYALPEIPVLGPFFLQTLLVPIGRLLAPSMNRDAFHPVETPPEYLDLMAHLGARPAQFKAYTQEWQEHHANMTALAPHYGTIQVPVTIIAGAEDRLTPVEVHAEPLHHAIPGSTLIVLPGTGHEVHYQHPEVVVTAVQALVR
jgi:pimeloyl-ACP methyl ester carboxylesterase